MKAIIRVKDAYIRFVEKQGFPIIITVCVAVITASALWTKQQEDAWVAPTPPVSRDVSAAQLIQQSLQQAAAATAAPTAPPTIWQPPLEHTDVLAPFNAKAMTRSGVTGIWAIHDAVDFAADRGSLVHAMADGVVAAHGEDPLQGVWILIDHPEGVTALYAGMAMGGAFITGDTVVGGDVIGYSGNGLLGEQDTSPHLHLRVTRNGTVIDPTQLWTK